MAKEAIASFFCVTKNAIRSLSCIKRQVTSVQNGHKK